MSAMLPKGRVVNGYRVLGPLGRGKFSVVYQAASPDEGALVEAAKRIGWEFVSRTSTALTYKRNGKETTVDVLAINEFSSSRKRMSILVRDREGGPSFHATVRTPPSHTCPCPALSYCWYLRVPVLVRGSRAVIACCALPAPPTKGS